MSDSSQGPGWWLASDGKWYPPETAPPPSTTANYNERRRPAAATRTGNAVVTGGERGSHFLNRPGRNRTTTINGCHRRHRTTDSTVNRPRSTTTATPTEFDP